MDVQRTQLSGTQARPPQRLLLLHLALDLEAMSNAPSVPVPGEWWFVIAIPANLKSPGSQCVSQWLLSVQEIVQTDLMCPMIESARCLWVYSDIKELSPREHSLSPYCLFPLAPWLPCCWVMPLALCRKLDFLPCCPLFVAQACMQLGLARVPILILEGCLDTSCGLL